MRDFNESERRIITNAIKNSEESGVLEGANQIIKIARECGSMTHSKIAELCNVSVNSVFRWARANENAPSKAKANKILPLLRSLAQMSGLEQETHSCKKEMILEKKLSEASLEDLRDRARQLGFKVTFIDILE